MHGGEPGVYVRAGGELHQVLLVRSASIHHIRQPKALTDAQLFSQLQHRICRRLPAEDVVRDAAQREHIQAGTVGCVCPGCFGRQVHEAWRFHIVFNVARAGGAVNGVGRRRIAGVALRGLPVHQLQLRVAAVNALHQDALRAQGPVEHAVRVGVLQGLRHAAHHVQALGEGQPGALVAQQVVEPLGLGVVVEDQRCAQLGLLVLLDLQDAGVVNAFQHLEFTAGKT